MQANNILGAEEHSESKTIQEISRTQQSSHRSQLETSATLQETSNVSLLRDIVAAVATLLVQQRHDLQVLGTCILVLREREEGRKEKKIRGRGGGVNFIIKKTE
jgi:hypothetical protein